MLSQSLLDKKKELFIFRGDKTKGTLTLTVLDETNDYFIRWNKIKGLRCRSIVWMDQKNTYIQIE